MSPAGLDDAGEAFMAGQRIGVVKQAEGETRVAATPKTVEQLIKLGYQVAVESGAGRAG